MNEDAKLGYPDRTCPICGNIFTPRSAAQVTCTRECLLVRRKLQAAATRARISEIPSLRERIKVLTTEVEDLKDELERVKAEGASEEMAQLQAQVARLREQNKLLQEKSADAGELDSLRIRLKVLDDTNSKLIDENAIMRAALTSPLEAGETFEQRGQRVLGVLDHLEPLPPREGDSAEMKRAREIGNRVIAALGDPQPARVTQFQESTQKEPKGEDNPSPIPEEHTVTPVTPVFKFCKRIGVRAINLPCGKKDECWIPKRCPNMPDAVKNHPNAITE